MSLISSFAEGLPLCEVGVVEAHIAFCAGLVRAPHCQNGPEPVKEPTGPAMLLERNIQVMTSVFGHQLLDAFWEAVGQIASTSCEAQLLFVSLSEKSS